MPTSMNTGSFNALFMVFTVAIASGTTKLTQFSSLLAFALLWRTLVSKRDVSVTTTTLQLPVVCSAFSLTIC